MSEVASPDVHDLAMSVEPNDGAGDPVPGTIPRRVTMASR